MEPKDLTIHSVVKNEPFVYYSIKSIYDYCNTILLYDTGSDDENTLQDIEKLLSEDIDNKIIFKEDIIEFEEDKWTVDTLTRFREDNKGKKGVAEVRQNQLNETKTKYFMVVDGDEVHYREGMISINSYTMPENIILTQIPLIWFYDLENTFNCYSPTGRIFRTDSCELRLGLAAEVHINKKTKKVFSNNDKTVNRLNIKPYAHFETLLKPYRRKHKIKEVFPFMGELPEVMIKNSYYIDRFLELNNET